MSRDAVIGHVRRTPAVSPGRVVAGLAMLLACAGHASAQPKAAVSALEKDLLGREARSRVDMPATAAGIDLHLQREPEVDGDLLSRRLKEYGVAIRKGQTALITKIKVNKKNIELHLGAGGYGTFGDDDGLVIAKLDGPSPRQTELERERSRTTDPKRRKEIDRELDLLREALIRQHEEAFRHAKALTEINKREIARKRLDGGSRFNIWYADRRLEQWAPTPDELMSTLADYLELVPAEEGPPRAAASSASSRDGATRGPATAASSVHRGMTTAQVYDVLGFPSTRKAAPQGELDGSVETWDTRTHVIVVTFVGGVVVEFVSSSK